MHTAAPVPVIVGIDNLPPVKDREKLRKLISLVPSQLREDALQEAWVAHLEKRDVCRAVDRFREKERAYAERHPQLDDEN